jgi:hypothetical protein
MQGDTPPSLGEIAYLAYWRRYPALALPWPRLSQRERAAWDAAARAARAAGQTCERAPARANGTAHG